VAIESDIFTALSGYGGLSALVVSRIYPIKAPQKPTYPMIVYRRISNNELNALDGSAGLANSRFQFSVYANTYISASSVSDQIKLAMAASTITSLQISRIDLDFDDSSENYSIAIDFSVWHN